jgi:hypothetical protein
LPYLQPGLFNEGVKIQLALLADRSNRSIGVSLLISYDWKSADPAWLRFGDPIHSMAERGLRLQFWPFSYRSPGFAIRIIRMMSIAYITRNNKIAKNHSVSPIFGLDRRITGCSHRCFFDPGYNVMFSRTIISLTSWRSLGIVGLVAFLCFFSNYSGSVGVGKGPRKVSSLCGWRCKDGRHGRFRFAWGLDHSLCI